MWQPISKYLSNTFISLSCSIYHRTKQLILVDFAFNLLLITIPHSVALKGNTEWYSSSGFTQKSSPKKWPLLSVTDHLVQKLLCNIAQGHPLTLDVKRETAENDWSYTMKWELHMICFIVKLTIKICNTEGVWYFKPLDYFSLGETWSQMWLNAQSIFLALCEDQSPFHTLCSGIVSDLCWGIEHKLPSLLSSFTVQSSHLKEKYSSGTLPQ